MHGVINMNDEDGFEPTSESTHLSLPTRYELANGFTSTPSRLLGDLEEKHLPQTFSIAIIILSTEGNYYGFPPTEEKTIKVENIDRHVYATPLKCPETITSIKSCHHVTRYT